MANSKSRIALIAWLGLVAMLSGTVAIHAQCVGEYHNFGAFIGHECLYTQECGDDSSCEHDSCYCRRTGQGGYSTYCTVADNCGLYPSCNTC
jgi:hypothetical protein